MRRIRLCDVYDLFITLVNAYTVVEILYDALKARNQVVGDYRAECQNTTANKIERCRACDGKMDPIMLDIIQPGMGTCVNNRCYSTDTLHTLVRSSERCVDPFTNQPFTTHDPT